MKHTLLFLTLLSVIVTASMAEALGQRIRTSTRQQENAAPQQQEKSASGRVTALAPTPDSAPAPSSSSVSGGSESVTKGSPAAPDKLTHDKRTHVLLIGVNKYPVPPKEEVGHVVATFDDLRFCAKDMRDLKYALVKACFCEEKDITLMVTGEGGVNEPTSTNVMRAFHALLEKIEPGDRVLIAFSGHGISLPSVANPDISEDHLCCADAVVIYNSILGSKDTTRGIIPRHQIEEALDGSKAVTKLVIIDACRNEASEMKGMLKGENAKNGSAVPRFDGAKGLGGIKGAGAYGSGKTLPSKIDNKGFFRLSSCSPGEISWECPAEDVQRGAFTHFLIKGMLGEAPQRTPGTITLDDIQYFVSEKTNEFVKNLPPPVGFTSKDMVQNPCVHKGREDQRERDVIVSYCDVPESEPAISQEEYDRRMNEKQKEIDDANAQLKEYERKYNDLLNELNTNKTEREALQRQIASGQNSKREKKELQQKLTNLEKENKKLQGDLARVSDNVNTWKGNTGGGGRTWDGQVR